MFSYREDRIRFLQLVTERAPESLSALEARALATKIVADANRLKYWSEHVASHPTSYEEAAELHKKRARARARIADRVEQMGAIASFGGALGGVSLSWKANKKGFTHPGLFIPCEV